MMYLPKRHLAAITGNTQLTLELGVGPIKCNVTPGNPAKASFVTTVPLSRLGAVPAKTVAAYLAELDARDLEITIDQGVEMGRPSRIDAAVSLYKGRASSVTISGSAVQTMRGTLTL